MKLCCFRNSLISVRFALYDGKSRDPLPFIFTFLQAEKIDGGTDVLMQRARVSRHDYTALISRRRPQFNLQLPSTISGRISSRPAGRRGAACGPWA